jgi:hypothetical protein
MTMADEAKYDDGTWYTVTLGHFIGLLVDAGQDPAVKFRVVEDTKPDENGKFCRKMEIILLPDGYVREAASEGHVHSTLVALVQAGIVK